MKTKFLSLAVLSLSICTLAMATEYKSPHVNFKKTAPSQNEVKVAEFKEDYKVENAAKTERQIASAEDSEREPSSIAADEKKHVEPVVEENAVDEKLAPKPWLYRANKHKNY